MTKTQGLGELITSAEFARKARTADSTIRYWRHIGYGPTGFRVGRRVLYDAAECDQWLISLRDAERTTATGGTVR